jgi:hypothetical protein
MPLDRDSLSLKGRVRHCPPAALFCLSLYLHLSVCLSMAYIAFHLIALYLFCLPDVAGRKSPVKPVPAPAPDSEPTIPVVSSFTDGLASEVTPYRIAIMNATPKGKVKPPVQCNHSRYQLDHLLHELSLTLTHSLLSQSLQ